MPIGKYVTVPKVRAVLEALIGSDLASEQVEILLHGP